MCYNDHGYVTLDFTLYISYKTTFFKKIIVKSFLNRVLIFFAPEEAEHEFVTGATLLQLGCS